MSATLLTRSVADLEIREDGRTAIGRLVPYGEVTDIMDPTGEVYKEVFVRGAFEGAVSVPERIDLRYSHDGGFDNVLGQGYELSEEDDGLYGAFRLYESVATRARDVLNGHAKHLSVGFYPIKSRRRGGVVERVKAYLEHVAATSTPAYAGAEVLSVRQDVVLESTEVPAEVPGLDSIQDWLERHKNPGALADFQPDTGEGLDSVQKYLEDRKRWAERNNVYETLGEIVGG